MRHLLLPSLIFVSLTLLVSCSSSKQSRHPANTSVHTTEFIHDVPALRMRSGMLLAPHNQKCDRLRIYFPGFAQELGKTHTLSSDEEQVRWISYLVGRGNYHLKPQIIKNGCPILILNDSATSPSLGELQEAMDHAGARNLEILSHSGGYMGLQKALMTWNKSAIKTISSIVMLDNFYNPLMAELMMEKIGSEKLKEICSGFSTNHRGISFLEVCPGLEIDKDTKIPGESSGERAKRKRDFTHKGSVSNFFNVTFVVTKPLLLI